MSIILENPHRASCANRINLYEYDLDNKSVDNIINDFDIDQDVIDDFPFDEIDRPKEDLINEANSSRFHSTIVFHSVEELADYYYKIRNWTKQHNILLIQSAVERYFRDNYDFDIQNEPLEYLEID